LAPCQFLDLDEENGAQENRSVHKDSLRERQSIIKNMADKKENGALFNNYLLNEIKAQDDAIKQVMSISALLIGAYATMIINSIGKIPTGLLNNTTCILLANTTQEKSCLNMQNFYFIALFLPFIFWICAITISVMVLSPTANKWFFYESSRKINYKLDEENFLINFLIETTQLNYRKYQISSFLMVAGLMLAFFIAMISLQTE
jgi:hypothetical protein